MLVGQPIWKLSSCGHEDSEEGRQNRQPAFWNMSFFLAEKEGASWPILSVDPGRWPDWVEVATSASDSCEKRISFWKIGVDHPKSIILLGIRLCFTFCDLHHITSSCDQHKWLVRLVSCYGLVHLLKTAETKEALKKHPSRTITWKSHHRNNKDINTTHLQKTIPAGLVEAQRVNFRLKSRHAGSKQDKDGGGQSGQGPWHPTVGKWVLSLNKNGEKKTCSISENLQKCSTILAHRMRWIFLLIAM